MQNKPTRPPKKETVTDRGEKATLWSSQTKFDPDEAVQNALISEPDLPSIQIAERLAKEAMAHPDFIENFFRRFFFRSLKQSREKAARAKHEQYRLPGFEHLPIRIQGAKEKVELLDATYRGVREWVKHLNAKSWETPRMKEAKALLEKMHEAAKRDPGITVRGALGLK
jgi:hypothetical protein